MLYATYSSSAALALLRDSSAAPRAGSCAPKAVRALSTSSDACCLRCIAAAKSSAAAACDCAASSAFAVAAWISATRTCAACSPSRTGPRRAETFASRALPSSSMATASKLPRSAPAFAQMLGKAEMREASTLVPSSSGRRASKLPAPPATSGAKCSATDASADFRRATAASCSRPAAMFASVFSDSSAFAAPLAAVAASSEAVFVCTSSSTPAMTDVAAATAASSSALDASISRIFSSSASTARCSCIRTSSITSPIMRTACSWHPPLSSAGTPKPFGMQASNIFFTLSGSALCISMPACTPAKFGLALGFFAAAAAWHSPVLLAPFGMLDADAVRSERVAVMRCNV
mmetsp:Transcript_87626/g.253050  ORF Transcript_87626/g.253050 Transcript_87626/m.253050 type:complete len:348 (+) Transcript_87626:157-1200(+)